MIKKIFKFDRVIAKENKCCASLIETILVFFLFLILLGVYCLIGYLIDKLLWQYYFFLSLAILVWIASCILILTFYDGYVVARRSCIIIDESNRIYILKDRKDGSSWLLGGSIDNINKQDLTSNKDNFFTNILYDFKFLTTFFKMRSSYKSMQDEDYIRKAYKNANHSIEYGKYLITSIESFENKGKYYLLKGSSMNCRSYRKVNNYKFRLYKVYSDMNELVTLLEKEK